MGPAKSKPQTENGGASLTLSFGKGAVIWSAGLERFFTDYVIFNDTLDQLMAFWYQKRDRILVKVLA